MGLVPVMWTVWGLSVFFMAVVTIIAARFGRNEEDQLMLAESSSQ